MNRRSTRATTDEIVADLMAVKAMIRSLKHALPALQAEIRADACERIDDIVRDLGSMMR